MDKVGVLVKQESFKLNNDKLSKLKTTFVKNINCLITDCNSYNDVAILECSDDSKLVCEGDTVKLELTYYDNEKETIEVTLLDDECDILNDEVSTCSPLGESIYNKQVGEKHSYIINGGRVYVKILEKIA